MTIIEFLFPSIAACVVLAGIHTYLGIHVITRGVIFLDIALAQIAALGMTAAFLAGFEPDSIIAYFFSAGATLIGAVFFTLFRDEMRHQEALIGVAFAVSSAASILLADRLPHGSEHLKYILNGNILWVEWKKILLTAALYAVIGLLHFLCRKPLLAISKDPDEAAKRGIKIRAWDFFFYLTFGLVITSSVQMAGILLVFSFLIVPALCASLFTNGLKGQLVIGWILGVVLSSSGVFLSYTGDLPTGATIVVVFGAALFFSLILKKLGCLRKLCS